MAYPNPDPNPVGADIAAFVMSQRPSPGTPISEAELITLWQGIVNIVYLDLKANLGILPGTFVVAGVQAGGSTMPVTGIGGPAE